MRDRRSIEPLCYGPRKREYAYMALALALVLFAWHGGDRPEDRVLPTLNDTRLLCQRTDAGQPLRVAINHCPDGTPWRRFCYHECGYEAITL